MNKKIIVKIIMLFVVQSVSLVASFYGVTVDPVTKRMLENADDEIPKVSISPYTLECLDDSQKLNVLPFIDNLKKKERGDFGDEDRSLFEKIDFEAKPILIMGAILNEISSIELKGMEEFKEDLHEVWFDEIRHLLQIKFEAQAYVRMRVKHINSKRTVQDLMRIQEEERIQERLQEEKRIQKEERLQEEKRIQEEMSKKNSYCALDKSLKLLQEKKRLEKAAKCFCVIQ